MHLCRVESGYQKCLALREVDSQRAQTYLSAHPTQRHVKIANHHTSSRQASSQSIHIENHLSSRRCCSSSSILLIVNSVSFLLSSIDASLQMPGHESLLEMVDRGTQSIQATLSLDDKRTLLQDALFIHFMHRSFGTAAGLPVPQPLLKRSQLCQRDSPAVEAAAGSEVARPHVRSLHAPFWVRARRCTSPKQLLR